MTNALYIMVGIPASGKSTYAHKEQKKLEAEGYTTAIISRDQIRKRLVKNKEYFSCENEVFDTFVNKINDCIKSGINYIFADATHISAGSRAKVLNQLNLNSSINLIFEVFPITLETALERNRNREGFARVPDSAIQKMYERFSIPTTKELKKYNCNIFINVHYVNIHRIEGD